MSSVCPTDKRIRYERNDRGIPIPRNFNRAFRLSRGRYFKWQAHDDLIGPEFLNHCVKILDEDLTTLLVATRVGFIERDGSPVPLEAERGMLVTSYGEQIPVPPLAGSESCVGVSSAHRAVPKRAVRYPRSR